MKRLILSDIHLGDDHLTQEAIDKIIQLIQDPQYGEIILLGDILELTGNPRNPRKAVRAAAPLWNELLKIHREGIRRVVYVVGNHDAPVRKLLPHPTIVHRESYSFIADGQKVIAMHGHQWDPHNKTNTPLALILTRLNQILSTAGINYRKYKRRFSFAKEATEKMRLEQRERIVREMTGRCDIFLYGHTHTQEVHKAGNLTVVNSGDLIDSGTYLVMDGATPILKTL